MSQAFDKLLDARGLNCPMPLVNARKEIGKLALGQVLKVVATDKGSISGLSGLGQGREECRASRSGDESGEGSNVYVHYVKRRT